MSSQHAMFDTPDKIRENFKANGFVYYLIVDHKGEILARGEDDQDLEDAANDIHSFFVNIRRGNAAIYTVKQFKKIPSGGFKKTSEADCISTFKRKEYYDDERTPYQSSYAGQGKYDTILDELRSLRQEMAQMKIDQAIAEAEEDEEIEEETQPQNILGSIMGHPQFQEVLINFLTNITANLTTAMGAKQQPAPATTLAGTNSNVDEITLEKVLQTLFDKGVTPQDLYKLSQFSESKIKKLLTFLRM